MSDTNSWQYDLATFCMYLPLLPVALALGALGFAVIVLMCTVSVALVMWTASAGMIWAGPLIITLAITAAVLAGFHLQDAKDFLEETADR